MRAIKRRNEDGVGRNGEALHRGVEQKHTWAKRFLFVIILSATILAIVNSGKKLNHYY